jgi:hypothetical protein
MAGYMVANDCERSAGNEMENSSCDPILMTGWRLTKPSRQDRASSAGTRFDHGASVYEAWVSDTRRRNSPGSTAGGGGGLNMVMHVTFWLGRAMAQAVSRRPRFAPRSTQWDLWWTKWHWERFFSESLRFSPVNIIPPWAPHFRKFKQIVLSLIHLFIDSHPRTNNRPVKAAAVQCETSVSPP